MVKIQILLKKSWRSAHGIAMVQELARQVGMTITGVGAATISAEVDEALFETLFRVPASDTMARTPQQHGVDRLKVPESMQEYVESLSVPPPYERLAHD
jgi:hypothetical protein